ncbi:hypothetical protein F3Y22_tig00111059pilonHSYRG00147 [Hibiscus syriacus]|uniref:Protein kinase domain-containing protein n=1 Tax=Hibiscus syriacus TaxID=106335 RepID=A0A6A2Z502_HIBSY|nr:hypothetical protein F3Y22_tig00111059pilonHSYRG00147 [Hibiscus syriacus]
MGRYAPRGVKSTYNAVKQSLSDLTHALSYWNHRDNTPCKWRGISYNSLIGRIESIDLSGCNIVGRIPSSFGRLVHLRNLDLSLNRITGSIPSSISELKSIEQNELYNNSLSDARVWAEYGSSTIVSRVEFQTTSGGYPKYFCSSLLKIPLVEKFQRRFQVLTIYPFYQFPETASPDRYRMKSGLWRHCENKINGTIPEEVKGLMNLNELNLANNRLSVSIPSDIGILHVVNYLDLSSNSFFGKVPMELQNLKLNVLNLSNDELSGDLPPLYDKENYRSSFVGNPGLCGDLDGLFPKINLSKNENCSYGYIAPEYVYTLRMNEKSDIYSFGVILLELVIGKPTTDPDFGAKDMVTWVSSTYNQKGAEQVIDPRLDSTYKEQICRGYFIVDSRVW